eukprot:6200428-Pleurochrysis_carterae.AAC.5
METSVVFGGMPSTAHERARASEHSCRSHRASSSCPPISATSAAKFPLRSCTLSVRPQVSRNHRQSVTYPPHAALCSGEWPCRCVEVQSTPRSRSQFANLRSPSPADPPARIWGHVPSQCCAPQSNALRCATSTPHTSTKYVTTAIWFCQTAS